MHVAIRSICVALLGVMPMVRANGAAVDPAAVQITTPAEIKWVRNAAGTNESAVLFGDPSKPGPYVMRIR